ncbi:unnamed protein product, partial [Mesorhabditis spiculigera]
MLALIFLFICALTVGAQQDQAGTSEKLTHTYHQQSSQISTGSCCVQPQAPARRPLVEFGRWPSLQPPVRQQQTKTWHISGFLENYPRTYGHTKQSTVTTSSVEYSLQQNGEQQTLSLSYNDGKCLVTLDSITENGNRRALDFNTQREVRAYTNAMKAWQQKVMAAKERGVANNWEGEPDVPRCPCKPEVCGETITEVSSNQPQPLLHTGESKQTWADQYSVQPVANNNRYEFRFNNGRCLVKDGVITEDGIVKQLGYAEQQKLEEFKRAFENYTRELHQSMRQQMDDYLRRNKQDMQLQVQQPRMVEPPCLCSAQACGTEVA